MQAATQALRPIQVIHMHVSILKGATNRDVSCSVVTSMRYPKAAKMQLYNLTDSPGKSKNGNGLTVSKWI